jgi:hypothetical protein
MWPHLIEHYYQKEIEEYYDAEEPNFGTLLLDQHKEAAMQTKVYMYM